MTYKLITNSGYLPNDTKNLLKIPCIPYDFGVQSSDETKKLGADLLKMMIGLKGLGLSANQVNVPYRIFVVNFMVLRTGHGIFFNPEVISTSKETVLMEEGCLSYPGLFVKIKRPVSITLRFWDTSGTEHTQEFKGLGARVIQHELDHLDGREFFSSTSKYHLARGKERSQLMLRKSRQQEKKIETRKKVLEGLKKLEEDQKNVVKTNLDVVK